jgi:hypothetical protein
MADAPRTLTCSRCQQTLVPRRTHFRYLGHEFHADVPTCPGCGEVFISEEMAMGRMSEVEMQLEDK